MLFQKSNKKRKDICLSNSSATAFDIAQKAIEYSLNEKKFTILHAWIKFDTAIQQTEGVKYELIRIEAEYACGGRTFEFSVSIHLESGRYGRTTWTLPNTSSICIDAKTSVDGYREFQFHLKKDKYSFVAASATDQNELEKLQRKSHHIAVNTPILF
jgi:hypothetical protein